MQREPIVFLPAPVAAPDLAVFARPFLGIRYSTHRNYLLRSADDTFDFSKSSLNCYGFLLATARAAGLLPDGFDLQRARWRVGQTVDGALREMLETNFAPVERDEAQVGDVFLMWFRDVDNSTTGPHHVAIKTAATPIINQRRGQMMHAVEADYNMNGAVVEQDVDALEWARIDSVWRLKPADQRG